MEAMHFYSTDVAWTGERHGSLSGPVLPTLQVDAPPEFRGHEGVWTPEHLFVGAINSCFMTTFVAIAENSKLDFVDFDSKATGKLEKQDDVGMMMTLVVLRPRLTIRNARDEERALRILEKAERHCLIANSVKTRIRLEPEIKVADQLAA
ncbi:MAG TPA: OsmC family protein [Pyrinomonadaceae bacterium]